MIFFDLLQSATTIVINESLQHLGNKPTQLAQPVYLADVLQDSLVDGPGLRNVVFFSGCQVKCPDCHNQAYWDQNSGQQITVQDLINKLLRMSEHSGHRNITFSGGEPMEQLPAMMMLINALPEFDFGLYTSYPLERVPQALLSKLSFIKVGRYLKKKHISGQYFGSSNQRLIQLTPQG